MTSSLPLANHLAPLLWLLNILLVVARAGPWTHGGAGDDSKERWLADEVFYEPEYPDDQPQADGAKLTVHSDNLCPPVPKTLPERGCDPFLQCSSDRECTQPDFKCCYNGCIYTCLPELKPAPFIDWIREPRRRLKFGRSWLVPGSYVPPDVELCSTTPLDDDSDPLLCPHGYECLVEEEGNPARGIPNSGRCVRASVTTQHTHHFGQLVPQEAQTSGLDLEEDHASLHACHLDGSVMLLSGHQTQIDGRMCVCIEKELKCEPR